MTMASGPNERRRWSCARLSTTGQARRPGRMCGTLRSPTTLTPLSASTPPRFAVRTCTSLKAMCLPSCPAGSSVTRPSGPSSRSATASGPIGEGDRVLVSCISACGSCRFCRESRYGQCREGGWILGHTYDGVQAEFARVPFADNSVYRLPDSVSDEDALMLADILPTGYEVGVLNGQISPGDVVVVVGSGPVGLSAIMGARLFSPSHIVAIDLADRRLEAAKQFGADVTVNSAREDPARIVAGLDRRARRGRHHRGGRGAGDLRACREARPARRARRQRRRARPAGHAAPGGSVDQGHHHYHRPGRHVLHADAAAAAGRAARSPPVSS